MSRKETIQAAETPEKWRFCGAVPLAAIAKGRRACRAGWRNRGEGCDKLALVACTDETLAIQREDEEDFYIEGGQCVSKLGLRVAARLGGALEKWLAMDHVNRVS